NSVIQDEENVVHPSTSSNDEITGNSSQIDENVLKNLSEKSVIQYDENATQSSNGYSNQTDENAIQPSTISKNEVTGNS
ncbi:1433_t:CDS:2, partial [Racocetra persica]